MTPEYEVPGQSRYIFLWVYRKYILVTNKQLFEIVGIRDVRNYLSDHFTLQARLLLLPMLFHGGYLQGRQASLLTIPDPENFILADSKFQYLKALEPPPPALASPFHLNECHKPRSNWLKIAPLSAVIPVITGTWHALALKPSVGPS